MTSPIADFKCPECSKIEKDKSIVDINICPLCGIHMNRIYQLGGIHYKGSGFHCTDYK